MALNPHAKLITAAAAPYTPDPRDDTDPLAPPPHLRESSYRLTSETYDRRHATLRDLRHRITTLEHPPNSPSPVTSTSPLSIVRTDDPFLLMFLRAKKFRVPKAFLEYSNFSRAHADHAWLRHFDIDLVERLFSSSSFQLLPEQDKNGRLVLSMNMQMLAPLTEALGKEGSKHLLAAIFAMLETIALDVRAQIFGAVVIVDLTNLRLRTFSCLTVAEYLLSLDLCQHCYPLRARGMYVVREPWFVRGLFNVMSPFMKPVAKESLQTFGNDLTKLQKYVGKEALPQPYGGDLEYDEVANTKFWVDAVRQRAS